MLLYLLFMCIHIYIYIYIEIDTYIYSRAAGRSVAAVAEPTEKRACRNFAELYFIVEI